MKPLTEELRDEVQEWVEGHGVKMKDILFDSDKELWYINQETEEGFEKSYLPEQFQDYEF